MKCRNKKRCILFVFAFNYTNTIRCIFCCCLLRAIFFLLHPHITTRQFLFFTLQRFVFLYKLLRHCDIQVFLRFLLIAAPRVYASYLRRAIYKPKKSMIHLYKLFEMINAKKLSFIAQFRRARFCVQREKNIILKGFSTILVMQYLCPQTLSIHKIRI